LQAAHASCPWLVIWDDHEVENNYADAASQVAGTPPAEFLDRRAQAYQAWWDFMPVRLARPTGPDLRIYRDLSFGTLAHVFLLDGRQYRSIQACGDADQGINLAPPCDEWSQPDRTMLGTEQEQWLLAGIGASATTWNVVGNQVVLSDARLNGVVLNYDMWDGYPAARKRLVDGIAATGKSNVVVVTGDIHLAAVADVTAGTLDAAAPATPPTPVATELVGTSISSGALLPDAVESQVKQFPALKYLNVRKRGWVLNEVTAAGWKATYRVVDDVTKRDSAVTTDAEFVIVPTKPGATPA
jgi:alkaline phosphatase D